MEVDENMWSFFQNHLGYNDAEMKKFKDDPKNELILSKAPELMNKTIVIEVVASHGCNSQHKVGDKFYLDGAGNFISKLCPKRMCAFALSSFGGAVFGMHELFYAGVDPNEIIAGKIKSETGTTVYTRCGRRPDHMLLAMLYRL